MTAILTILKTLWDLRSYWREMIIGVLVIAVGVQTMRLRLSQAEMTSYKADQVIASQKLQRKADDLADKLTAARQAEAEARANVVIEYRDRIHNVTTPDTACARDPRMQLGSGGVRNIIRSATGQK